MRFPLLTSYTVTVTCHSGETDIGTLLLMKARTSFLLLTLIGPGSS